METKFFVVEAYRYAESKKWEYKHDGMFDSLAQAKQVFHSRLAAIIKNTNDFAMVMLYDSFGNRIDADYVDTSTQSEPESVPEQSSIVPE